VNISYFPELEYSCGITIRSVLLDMLLGLNFYKLLKDNLPKNLSDEEMKVLVMEFSQKALSDGLDNTAKYLDLAKKFGYLDEAKLKEYYNNFAIKYKGYLKPHSENGEMPETKYGIGSSPTFLFKQIANDSDMKDIASIYDLYLYYSKYDHFGIIYFETRAFTIQERVDRVKRAISLFVNHCANLFDILERVSQKDQFITAQYNIAMEYLASKNGV